MLKLFNGKHLRKVLRANRFVYLLNAKYKAHLSRRLIQTQQNYYTNEIGFQRINYNRNSVKKELRKKLEDRGALHSKPPGRLRIFWVGANEEQDKSGFLQALKSFGEVIEFKNSNGTYGLENSGPIFHDSNVVKRNDSALVKQFVDEYNKAKIDLLIGQFWSNYLSSESLEQIRKTKCVVANIAMDDRLPELWTKVDGKLMGSVGLASAVDLTLNTVEEFCPRYLCHGGQAIPWVLGSDPILFKPSDKKIYDISFIGSNYGVRPIYINKMRNSGLNVSTFGPGWPSGSVSAQRTAQIFGESKIVFGMATVGYHNNLFTLKLRDFDATMAGALYITNRHPELEKLFREDEEIVFYSTLKEAIDKMHFYLSNESACLGIGRQAAQKARALYTWSNRIQEALNFLGLLEAPQNVRN